MTPEEMNATEARLLKFGASEVAQCRARLYAACECFEIAA
jgi:hypothetical protein